jgi:hypothetical protein
MANRSESSGCSRLPAHDATDSAMYIERERPDTSGSTGVPPLDSFLPFSERRQADGTRDRHECSDGQQHAQAELKPAAIVFWHGVHCPIIRRNRPHKQVGRVNHSAIVARPPRRGGMNCSNCRPARPRLFGIVGCIFVPLHRWVGLDELHQLSPIDQIVLL